ncbi:MAG TPA: cupredoxin family copper-binding protein [Candidatus Limnocylindria bacterium]
MSRAVVWAAALAFSAALLATPFVAMAATSAVTIQDSSFKPPTTSIRVGDTVTWTNADAFSHTATSDTGAWDTGVIVANAAKSITFTSAGTFLYHCAIHSFMKGTIVVQAAATPQPTPTPPPPPPSTPPPPPPSTPLPTVARTPAPTNPPTPAPTAAPSAAPTSEAPSPSTSPSPSTTAAATLAVSPSPSPVAAALSPSPAPAGSDGSGAGLIAAAAVTVVGLAMVGLALRLVRRT